MKLNFIKFFLIIFIVNHTNSRDEKNCKTQIIKSFGLQSETTPNTSNVLCPAIKFNCCTKHDQMKIHKLYAEHSKNTLQVYYESVNHKFAEFLTKFVQRKDDINLEKIIEYLKTKTKDKPSDSLLSHLTTLKHKYNKKKSGALLEIGNPMKKSLKNHYKQVKSLRKTFLCNICNWKNHEFINPETMMITYNKSFCDNLVDKSIDLWHQKYVELYEYILVLDEFLYLVANLRLIEDQVDRQILHRYKKDVANCHANRDNDDICEILCKEYNINKFTYLIDGEVKLLDKMVKQFEIAHKHLSKKKEERELFLSRRSKNSHIRFRELKNITSTKRSEIETNSLNIQFDSRNVNEFANQKKLIDKVKLKTLDDEISTYTLYKLNGEPIELAKYKVEIKEDGGFDPHLDQKDMNLELSLEKLISNLYSGGNHNIQAEEIDEEVKTIVNTYNVKSITDFVKDSGLKYRNLMTAEQKEKALEELVNNPELQQAPVERKLVSAGFKIIGVSWIILIFSLF